MELFGVSTNAGQSPREPLAFSQLARANFSFRKGLNVSNTATNNASYQADPERYYLMVELEHIVKESIDWSCNKQAPAKRENDQQSSEHANMSYNAH